MQPKCSRTDDGRTYGFFIQRNATQQYEEITDTCNNMSESRRHAEWRKPNSKEVYTICFCYKGLEQIKWIYAAEISVCL